MRLNAKNKKILDFFEAINRSKTWIVMKITVILLFSFVTIVSAKSYSQRINLQLKNAKIEAVFARIEKMSGYNFIYEKNTMKKIAPIDVSLENSTVTEAMNVILKNQPLEFVIRNSFVVISPKEDPVKQLFPAVDVYKFNKIIGVVKDFTGMAIPNVSVLNKTTGKVVATNAEGAFTIDASSSDVLVFSFVGFKTIEEPVNGRTNINIVMIEDSGKLNEVVVTALGIKRSQKSLTYTAQQIGAEDLTTVKSSNFVNSLVGKVAGAQINTSSTGPGGGVKVIMRGSKSITRSNNVLYVIDGVPMNNTTPTGGDFSLAGQPATEGIADINPDDIESLSVLSGPSAAALYGNEGANGVIIINTKKGAVGKTAVTFSHNSMFSSPLMLPKFQNKYGNVSGEFGSWGAETDERFDPKNFFNTGTSINNVLSISTGTEKSQTYLSAAANNSTGILPNNKYDRYNFTYRNTTNFFDNKLVLDIGANYILQKNLNMVSQGQYFNPIPALYLFPRGEDFSRIQLFERYNQITEVNQQYWIYDDQGLSLQNPYWTMYRMNREDKRKRYMLNASLKYNITDYLNIVGRANIDNSSTNGSDSRYAGTLATLAGPKGRYGFIEKDDNQAYFDAIATFNKTFNDFSYNVNIGGSIKNKYIDYHKIEGDLSQITNLFSIENMSRNVGVYKVDQDRINLSTRSGFANAEIGYKNYLFLNSSFRRDYDSPLQGSTYNKKYFDYYSVGLSAVFSEMLQMPKWVSYLKARGGYVTVGNSGFGAYITQERYIYNEQTNTYALGTVRPNFNLKPENTRSLEFGLDMRFLNNSLSLSGTYYNSETNNQTHTVLESGTEYTGALIQTGSVTNKGVELMLGYQKTWGKFNWSSNATFSYNKNTVKKIFSDELLRATPGLLNQVDKSTLGSIGSPIVRLTEGGTMGDVYQTSDFKRDYNGYIYLNSNQLPVIESLTSENYKKLGSLLPSTNIGWKNSFSYNKFRLNVVLSGRFGGLVVSNTQAILDRFGVSAYSANLRDAGPINILGTNVAVKDYVNAISEGTGKGNQYVYKADNVRLQELSLEYTIDKKYLKNISNITVGIVGNNLAFLFNKAPFDPEASPSSSSTFYTGVDYFMQPSLRNIGFNLKLQF